MSNAFRRPMFRRGGEVMTGIMNNVTPRVNHGIGSPESFVTDYTQQLRESAGDPGGVDPLTAWLLRAGPRMMNEPKRGGSLATIFRATQEPTEQAIGDINKRASGERDLRLAGAQMGLTQHGKASLLEQKMAGEEPKISALDAQILVQTKEYKDTGINERIAKNMATYDYVIGPKMIENFTQDLVIDSDMVPAPDEKGSRVKWANKNKDNVGKYFYDPYDGTIKKIIMDPNDPTKKGLAFETFDATTFQAIDDTPDIEGGDIIDEMSVSLTWEDAQTEAAKRNITLIGPRPDDAGRGWIFREKEKNPGAITVQELEEIIKKEKFNERYKHIKQKSRYR